MSRTALQAGDGLELGGMIVPMWALWVLALVVVLLIVGIVVVRLARRARKIARASNDASRGAGEGDEPHGFGFFGAVTSAISIIPDVNSKSRGNDRSDSGR